MLKSIDPLISAELLHVLMLMGHGDDLVICDVNHPAAAIARETAYGKLISVTGAGIPRVLEAVLKLMPVDTFVDAPVKRMQVVGDAAKELPLFAEVKRVVETAEGREVKLEALERFSFYAAAKAAFAIVRTSDPGPYGCFIIRKGVVNPA